MNKLWANLIMSMAIAVIGWIVIFAFGQFTNENSIFGTILRIMGATFPSGMVQFFTLWLFSFGILGINSESKKVDDEQIAYQYRLLPEREQYVLGATDVNSIKLKAIEKERKGKRFLLTDLIKKACTKYRANKSTSEALEIVTAQVRINMNRAESEQSMIRYVAWAIPSVGFIGTIIGISASLGNVQGEMSNDDILVVTSALNVAFDTTLFSLFLSIIMMFYFHIIQSKIDNFHLNMEDYVIENLINRIYKS